LNRPRSLTFELAPLDPSGKPLFSAINEVHPASRRQRTSLRLMIHVRDIRADGAAAVAGIALG
jgi:hypothetical protein